MRKTEEITSFFYSQYFAEGLRITIGTIIPVVICAFFGEFKTGTLISLGALIVGLSDTPGAPRHRRFGMVYCTLLGIITIFITALFNSSLPLMTITIAVLAFLFSMLAVFNARAATIGTMCLLVMLINVDDVYTIRQEFTYLLYFLIGAVWYMIISFSIMQVRPYRLAQQELSETILQVAEYLRLKANFYDTNIGVDDNYIKLIERQIAVNAHQENVRDILFRSKRSIKDTTKEGRFLTLIFNDVIDLFEQSMTTHYDYDKVRINYGPSGILENIKEVILKATHELDNIAYKINANRIPKPIYDLEAEIDKLRIAVDRYDKTSEQSVIPLKKVLINIRMITKHIRDIYNYGQFKSVNVEKEEIQHSRKFLRNEALNWEKFRDNLSINSSIFRHALRMSIMLAGTYLTLNLLDYSSFGTYWILLTILVILKPGFGLTKERNVQRLIGTVIGGIIGGIILATVPDLTARFIILIIFFLIAYSLFRVNYIMAVIFMTPYVLIMLSFTGVNTIEMAKERILDTFLGGSLAFLSSYIIFPNWESFQIRANIRSLLIANYHYLAQAIKVLSGNMENVTSYKLARKEVYIASANMGSTFQRLLTEPKWRQNVTKEVNRFVILNHVFSSYTATLMTQLHDADNHHFNNAHLRQLYKALGNLEKTIVYISDDNDTPFEPVKGIERLDTDETESDDARLITEQLQFLIKISSDLQKITTDFAHKSEDLNKIKLNANGEGV
ncbi:TIGR01666 family membrane protein [Sphingobacterium nematocida]|uniref:TIGR01666 family membrane protein n=1 Tax=Sphingobacterium nematocida TaxID=1513896 RepID=A0A1T5CXX8_9SPHI|nr:FUSC family membrane protein [Sphingobacterium nematocida]SKB64203.1 TIGR01666 family membrane protein [Sphingobacterium nematocida]